MSLYLLLSLLCIACLCLSLFLFSVSLSLCPLIPSLSLSLSFFLSLPSLFFFRPHSTPPSLSISLPVSLFSSSLPHFTQTRSLCLSVSLSPFLSLTLSVFLYVLSLSSFFSHFLFLTHFLSLLLSARPLALSVSVSVSLFSFTLFPFLCPPSLSLSLSLLSLSLSLSLFSLFAGSDVALTDGSTSPDGARPWFELASVFLTRRIIATVVQAQPELSQYIKIGISFVNALIPAGQLASRIN